MRGRRRPRGRRGSEPISDEAEGDDEWLDGKYMALAPESEDEDTYADGKDSENE